MWLDFVIMLRLSPMEDFETVRKLCAEGERKEKKNVRILLHSHKFTSLKNLQFISLTPLQLKQYCAFQISR